MKTVRVRAANIKRGDIYEGRRIKEVLKYSKRIKVPRRVSNQNAPFRIHKLAYVGVLIIAPNPSGNKLDTFDFRGDKFVCVKRPKYNMSRTVSRRKI